MMEKADGEPDRTRRAILKAASAGSLATALGTLASEGVLAREVAPESTRGRTNLFRVKRAGHEPAYPQGVASGGPTASGAIVWTRIDPAAYEPGRDVGLEVATDSAFAERDVVYRARVPSERVGPAHDHTVKIDLNGELASDRHYHYRFIHGGDASPPGRLRTLPDPDASPEALRLALATCNNYNHGYFGAYGHMAEESVDFIVHLGDFVYEQGDPGQQPGRGIGLPSGNRRAHTLADFRHLHRTYRADENMQAALARHPIILTWDDHEIVNNRWWNYEAEAPNTESHPYGGDFEKMRQLYLAGIKALVEYVPMRVQYDPDAEHLHDVFRLYRSFQFGDLAELHMTDERFYRSPPPSDTKAESTLDNAADQRDTGIPPARDRDDADRTMLGAAQREWLVDGVTGTDALWSLWGGSVLHAPLKYTNAGPASFYLNYDAWDGYTYERRGIMGDFLRNGVDNLVVFSGDMHASVAAYMLADYEDLREQQPLPNEENRIGVEFMTPSVTSNNLAASIDLPSEVYEPAVEAGMEAQNPHVEWFNWTRYGYTTITIDRDACVHTAYRVDRTDDSESPPKTVMRSYRVPEGRTELQELYSEAPAPDTAPEGDEL